MISTELAALEEISKMCGEYEIKEKDKDGKEKKETRPLITVSDLQRLKFGEIILLRLRMNPFRTKIKPNFERDWGPAEKGGKATYPHREKEEVHLFDLKGYVNKKKEEKMSALVNQVMPGLGNKMSSRPVSPADLIKNIDAKIAELEKEERERKAKISSKSSNKSSTKEEIKSSESKDKKSSTKEDIKSIESKETKSKKETKKVSTPKISSEDFAAKITNRVNKSVNKVVDDKKNKVKKDNINEDYVTDDEFFDDFFADDDM